MWQVTTMWCLTQHNPPVDWERKDFPCTKEFRNQMLCEYIHFGIVERWKAFRLKKNISEVRFGSYLPHEHLKKLNEITKSVPETLFWLKDQTPQKQGASFNFHLVKGAKTSNSNWRTFSSATLTDIRMQKSAETFQGKTTVRGFYLHINLRVSTMSPQDTPRPFPLIARRSRQSKTSLCLRRARGRCCH